MEATGLVRRFPWSFVDCLSIASGALVDTLVLAIMKGPWAHPTLADIGFAQQAEIFDWVRAQTGTIPPVIDARDGRLSRPVLRHPLSTRNPPIDHSCRGVRRFRSMCFEMVRTVTIEVAAGAGERSKRNRRDPGTLRR